MKNAYNVGVDVIGFYPRTLQEILIFFEKTIQLLTRKTFLYRITNVVKNST